MRIAYFLTTIVVLNTSVSSCSQNNNKAKLTEIGKSNTPDTSSIAIIQFDPKGNWPFKNNSRPSGLTEKEIEEVESLMNIGISEYNKHLSVEQRDGYSIDFKKYKYKKQYVAVINLKGEKEVWINGFCNSWNDNWKKDILLVNDGGNCYFNLKVNLTTKKCYDVFVNGYA